MTVLEQLPGERWRRLEPLVDAALELAHEDWPAYLDSECAGDAALRADLERLLQACQRAEGFLAQPASQSFARLLTDLVARSLEGARVGPYRIVGDIGHGGMGAVYLAERADGQFKQRVALKLVRGALSTDDHLVRRFLAERQILASLEHPHIARLLDGGVTDAGIPWFAMEYVQGIPLVQYCDSHRYDIEQRLRLFLTVCDAVDYAHQNHVIHRDLKPSNILVTESGDVKLLDFGIAKLLSGGEAGETITQTGQRALTPEYASPEQIRGGLVTRASDVYSLGVVLCELLTGQRPFRTDRHAPAETERTILQEEPDRPSGIIARQDGAVPVVGSLSRKQLVRQLKGDLDAVVFAALQKEPERRLATVEELASDLRRHLQHLPIVARGDNWTYGARKFMRRHQRSGILVSVAVAAGLGVLGFSIVMQGRQATPLAPAPPPSASVAVLPFTSTSGEGQSRFTKLLAHEVVRYLNRLPDIRALEGDARLPPRDSHSALTLGVRHVLAGTVEGVGSGLRVTVELVGPESASRVWSRTYEASETGLALLADRIARESAAMLLVPTIAFTSNRDGNDEIYVMTVEGARPINLTRHPATDVDPTWSPDGQRIAFSSRRIAPGTDFDIWVMNADGSGQRRLTHGPIASEQAAWSPDGDRIAFMTDRDFNKEVYVMKSDGSDATNLSRHLAGDEQPAWSPDGRRIAFVSNRDLDIEIYVMNADGTNVRRLTNTIGMDYEPAWSPDGKRIAFWSGRADNFDIYVMNADGTGTRRLTSHSATDFHPTWTRTGTEILFHSSRDGNPEVYIMGADGTAVRRLTSHPAVDMQPKVR